MRIITCALQCEAQAFIDHFSMKSILNHPFKIHQKNDILLIISGIGKLNMAAACAYVYAKFNNPVCSWLNIGICGARKKPIGSIFIANKVSADFSMLYGYPPLIIKTEIESSPLITVDQPTENYKNNNIYDMEAAGFYATCIKFTTTELVSCLKVVSDNEQQSIKNIDKNYVHELMGNALSSILTYFDQQNELLQEYQLEKQTPVYYHELTTAFHFTKTQQHQLKKALDRLTLNSNNDINIELNKYSNAKQVLQYLDNLLTLQKVKL